jgi:hypothetical protein
MCFSKAPKVKPIAQAPSAPPEIIDDVAVKERDDMLRKRRLAYGRQSTIIAGNSAGAGAPPTAPVKTALGS